MGKPSRYLGEETAKGKVLRQDCAWCVRRTARRRLVGSSGVNNKESGKRRK